MRPQGKLLFSKMMRKAIWIWVNSYPDQFAEVYASNARLLPGSEVLFDMCSSAADTPKKKAVLWPLQTMLLTLSPDFLTQAFLDNSPNLNRRVSCHYFTRI
jgi:neurofibromin 1